MKAITVSILPSTDTLPRRLKAKAEGVPPITRSIDKVESIGGSGILPTEAACKKLALELCAKYEWGRNLAGGVLPDGRTYVFCFIPNAREVNAARDRLSDAVENPERVADDGLIDAAVALLQALNQVDI